MLYFKAFLFFSSKYHVMTNAAFSTTNLLLLKSKSLLFYKKRIWKTIFFMVYNIYAFLIFANLSYWYIILFSFPNNLGGWILEKIRNNYICSKMQNIIQIFKFTKKFKKYMNTSHTNRFLNFLGLQFQLTSMSLKVWVCGESQVLVSIYCETWRVNRHMNFHAGSRVEFSVPLNPSWLSHHPSW